MEAPSQPLNARDIVGALDWWREAGVDCDFADNAEPWIGIEPDVAPAPASSVTGVRHAPAPPPVERPRFGGDSGGWPAGLSEFKAWWMAEPLLGEARLRVPPKGEAQAEVMIIVEQPEPEDRESLLSGTQGRALSAMLKAMGIPAESAYFASALPRHQPMPDWNDLRESGLGDLLSHHVGLVAPKYVLVFGSNIPSLLGNDLTQNPQTSPSFNQGEHRFPALFDRSLDALQRGKAKAAWWRRWLEMTGA